MYNVYTQIPSSFKSAHFLYIIVNFRQFFFGKIPPKSERNCKSNHSESSVIKYTDKSTKSRWYCSAQFDLFFPEPKDAPHIVLHSQDPIERSLFDISHEYTKSNKEQREYWSKIPEISIVI